MITVNGVLTVKEISGANGKFCTGDLNTSIGEFKVKEAILDQFEEGRYEGEFVIERFYLSSYVWRGKSTTDIRAKVTDIRLDNAEEGEVDVSPLPEQDPATENVAELVSGAIAAATRGNIAESDELSKLFDLFGTELAQAITDKATVKLDPTVDRSVFREQRDKLKSLGYSFQAISQSWVAGEQNV